jgi:CheY-like chemotaxis protein
VEIVRVTDWEEALQELSEVPSQAFLINDMSVSGMLGHLESTQLPNGTPVMICSVPGTYESAGTLGASDYLVKPVSQDALLAALDRLDLPGRTVLIVDDEPDMLRLFRRMLATSGKRYRVLRARNGQEALSILRDDHPNVIVLDLVMPKMDGFQLLQAKSQDPALRNIPVIVVSARDPAGQPIVSNALAITQGGGLSIHHLLTYIKMTGQLLSAFGQPADSASPKVLFD